MSKKVGGKIGLQGILAFIVKSRTGALFIAFKVCVSQTSRERCGALDSSKRNTLYVEFFIFNFNWNSSYLTVLLSHATALPHSPCRNWVTCHTMGRDILCLLNTSPCPVLSANTSQSSPPRDHLYIYGPQDFVSMIETDDNRSESNFPA